MRACGPPVYYAGTIDCRRGKSKSKFALWLAEYALVSLRFEIRDLFFIFVW